MIRRTVATASDIGPHGLRCMDCGLLIHPMVELICGGCAGDDDE